MAPSPKIVVLDRDGVINRDSDAYIKSPEEWQPLPGSLDAIARLTAAGYRVVVVSNQSGIGRGLFDRTMLGRIHAKMQAAVEAAGGHLAGVYYCPHAPTDDCDCRKPGTGMLMQARAELAIDTFAEVPVIGDKIADMGLAAAVGARGILVQTGKGAKSAESAGSGCEIYPDLARAVDALLAEERE